MIYGLFIFLMGTFITFLFVDQVAQRHPQVDKVFLKQLYFYHFILWIAYFTYAAFNRSDSHHYFNQISQNLGDNWLSYYGTSTTFIKFLAYPLVHSLNFTYEAAMVLFGIFGYWGFVYFYIFFKENIRFRHEIWGVDAVTLLFLLPNTHFWTNSLGKGSVIFLGIGLLFYGISKLNTRWVAVIIGALLTYHIRPHVAFILFVASSIGFVSSSKQVNPFMKLAFILSMVVVSYSIFDKVLALTGLESGIFEESTTLSHRASELSKATSGIDIQSYSVPLQLFTFWFRPLFIDASGMLGLIVSFENLVYVLILITFLRMDFFLFLWRGDYLTKTAFITFLVVSYPLAQISGNLGLAIRQKSMVMILLFFLVFYYLDQKKMSRFKEFQFFQWKRNKLNKLAKNIKPKLINQKGKI